MKIFSKKITYIVIMIFVITTSVFGPVLLSKYGDKKILNSVVIEDTDIEGYKYILTPKERLYILSNAIENRVLLQSDFSASIRLRSNLEKMEKQSYAFIANYNNVEINDNTKEKVILNLKSEFLKLQNQDIIPQFDFDTNVTSYDIKLFSALDILEPKKTVQVWQIETNSEAFHAGNFNSNISCYVDFETGKLYGFSFRSSKDWSFYDPDRIIKSWCDYMDVGIPKEYKPDNPSLEETKYYKKYVIESENGDKIIVTIGFYEGTNEFFLKISNK